MIRDLLRTLVERTDLQPHEAEGAMEEILTGVATPAQVAGFLTALRMKGETVAEITAFARVMRSHALIIHPAVAGTIVDTCGTGGDHAATFNISTAAAFVAAGAGVPVMKHGNRSVSSRCGSADVLESLGLNLGLDPEKICRVFERTGIAFLYAPAHHPALRHAMGPRRELGIRTVFNLLGPLVNPSCAQAQLVGVYDPDLTEKIAQVLGLLGCWRAMVVHGGGLDEITTTGETRVSELIDGELRDYVLRCEEFGIPRADLKELEGGDAGINAGILRGILAGEPGPRRDIVLLNAAAAIYLGGRADTLQAGLSQAEQSIDSGRAYGKLEALIRATGGAE